MPNAKPLPIVLAHGIARFDVLLEILKQKVKVPDTNLGERFHYFKGIKPHLEAHGFTVSHPNQDFAGDDKVGTIKAARRGGVITNWCCEGACHSAQHGWARRASYDCRPRDG